MDTGPPKIPKNSAALSMLSTKALPVGHEYTVEKVYFC